MAWVRLDDARATHPKLRAAGFAARGLEEAALCMSAHDESDGFISDDTLHVLGVLHHEEDVVALATILVDVGRWRRDDRRGGWLIRDFLTYNPSHADLAARRETERRRREKGRATQGERRPRPSGRDPDVTRNPSGHEADVSGPVPSRPVPSRSPTDVVTSDDNPRVGDDGLVITDEQTEENLAKLRQIQAGLLKAVPS